MTPSEILFGSVESGMQDETAHEALLSDLSHLESTHYHHGCDGFFFWGGETCRNLFVIQNYRIQNSQWLGMF